MGRIGKIAFFALMVASCTARVLGQESGHAVGLVFSRGIDGTSCGNGFFVGDGTWFVTAKQVIFPTRPMGLHQGDAMVTVLSPYLGEAAEAQIVARDQDWDVVVLRMPWKGHPALPLAQEADVLAGVQVQVLGFGNIQSAVAGGRPQMIPPIPAVARQTVDVSGVVVRRSMSRSVITSPAPAGPGWAGAPMLLGDGRGVAGCYVRGQGDGAAGNGSAAGSIRRLIEQTGIATALQSAAHPIAPPAQTTEATRAYLLAISSSSAGDATAALQHFEEFLKLRPGSAIGLRDAAGQMCALKRFDEAQATYAKALEIDPQLVSARVLYGQLLHDRIMPRAAEEHLRYAWRYNRGSNAAVVPLCNVLRQQRKEAECLQILEQALKQNPLDGYLWSYVGQNRRATDDHAGAAAAFLRAASLLPENEASLVQAAEEFDAAGQPVRAEEQYRTLIEQNGDSPTAHYLLARLIARDRSRKDEALKHAALALNLSDRPGAPPRGVVQSLISAIRSGRAAPANDLSL